MKTILFITIQRP